MAPAAPPPSAGPAGPDRPALRPARVPRAVMVQRWVDVVFLHWRQDAAVVQRLLPDGVEVDPHDGAAWIGLVGFRLEDLAVPGLPPFPVVGSFPEVNVRTYVRAGGRPAVWFFSLDIDRRLPTAVARLTYHLPYCFGQVSHDRHGDRVTSRVARRWPRPATPGDASGRFTVRTGAAVEADELAHFLTARYGLVAAGRGGRLRHAPVDHPPWPLHHAEVLDLDERLVAAAGLPAPQGPAHALWSPGVEVRVGRPRRLDGRRRGRP